MKASVALLISGLAAQQVSATWNRNAGYFNSPQYNNNECSEKQKGGFDWSDLTDGQKNFGYGDFDFSKGWTCSNSFGKRDHITKRSFNSKCIKNTVRKDTPATFGCDKKKDGFSMNEFQVSTEYDAELVIHYKMPDNSVCKQRASCKKEGTTVTNTQCGGATGVEVYLGNHDQSGREDCEIGFHHIGFDCNPGTGYQPPPPVEYTPPAKSSTPAESKPATTPPPYASTPAESLPVYTPPSSAPIYSNSSKPVETPGYTPPPSCQGQECESPSSTPAPATSKPVETPGYTPPVCQGEECNTPSSSPVPESSASVPTPPVYGGSSSPVEVPSSTPAPAESNSGYVPSESTASAPLPSSSISVPTGGYTPPQCLPKCMNTWLQINSKCKDNTDANCYCKNADFTKSVIDCVAAWSSDEDTQKALQYLIGICASYVPENPGLITNCPSNIPINPTPTPTPEVPASSDVPVASSAPGYSAPSSPAESAPVASTPVESTPAQSSPAAECPGCSATYAIPTSEGPNTSAGNEQPPATSTPEAPAAPSVPCTTITYSSTTITVPQVVFTTNNPSAPGANPSEPVALVPGTTPPSVPAQTTLAPYPTSLGTVTVPTGTGSLVPSSPAQFTGAASPMNVEFKHALVGAALAFLAL